METEGPSLNDLLSNENDLMPSVNGENLAVLDGKKMTAIFIDDDMKLDSTTESYSLGDDSLEDFAMITHQWIKSIGEQTGIRQNRKTRPTVIETILSAYNQAGGWEIWAQVELTTLIEKHYSDHYAIDREVNVYPNGRNAKQIQRADFFLYNISNPNNSLVVELKVQKISSTRNSRLAILNEAQDDYEKLTTVKPDYQGYRRVAFAIVCAPDTVSSLRLKTEVLTPQQVEALPARERQYYEKSKNWNGYGVIRQDSQWISIVWQELPNYLDD